MSFCGLLREKFAPYFLLSAEQLTKLERHYQLLVQWNRVLNLTRIVDVEEAVALHYCESLFVGYSLPAGSVSVVDVGSGGGFPGIPLAILRPECRVDLIESHLRKAVFLREASRSIPNVTIIPTRAESAVGHWDWVVSRAVRGIDVLSYHLADRAALLLAQKDLQILPPAESVFQIPWERDHVLAMFHVEHNRDVSRGT